MKFGYMSLVKRGTKKNTQKPDSISPEIFLLTHRGAFPIILFIESNPVSSGIVLVLKEHGMTNKNEVGQKYKDVGNTIHIHYL